MKKRTQMSFDIDPILRKELHHLSVELEISIKEILNMLIKQFVEANKTGK